MKNLINNIRKHFNANHYLSEEAVKSRICDPILRELNWDINSPIQVVPEYKIDNLRVDIALCVSYAKPVIFIEVKAPRKCSLDGEKQIFDYAAREGGIPMIIFTDGNEWHFYNTYGTGNYKSRKAKTLELTRDSLDDSIKCFRRYLQYEQVKTERAFENLRKDYFELRQKEEAKLKIPEAWHSLVDGLSEELIGVIIAQVERNSAGNLKPDNKDVLDFLRTLKPQKAPRRDAAGSRGDSSRAESKPRRVSKPDAATMASVTVSPDQPSSPSSPVYRYKINGQVYKSKSGKDLYVEVLDYVLSKYDRIEELKDLNCNKIKSAEFGSGYHISEYKNEVPKKDEQKAILPKTKLWVNINTSSKDKSSKLLAIGSFYNQAESKKILGEWNSGAEVEFDIPTRQSKQ